MTRRCTKTTADVALDAIAQTAFDEHGGGGGVSVVIGSRTYIDSVPRRDAPNGGAAPSLEAARDARRGVCWCGGGVPPVVAMVVAHQVTVLHMLGAGCFGSQRQKCVREQ